MHKPYSRTLVVAIALALVVVACVSGSDRVGGEAPADPDTPTTVRIDDDDRPSGLQEPFPDPETWAADHPQPTDGLPFHLEVTFNVGPNFEGESIDVTLDGEPLVGGAWVPPEDPKVHSCPNPYRLVLEAGTHEIEALTGSGQTLNETFVLDDEAHGLIQYRHPEAWPELDEPMMVWMIDEGAPICE